MRKWAEALTLFLIITAPAFSQEKDLVINAQALNYSEDGNIVEALGSVEVFYKDIKAAGHRIVYYAADKRIYTNTGFALEYGKLNFSGLELDFNLKGRYGKAKEVVLHYEKAALIGKTADIDPDKIVLNDAVFTTCDLASPHYRFSAQNITLYPEEGWLICFWTVFWVDGVPTMPVPVYVYDLKADEKGLAHSVPYPQFGSDNYYGSYAVQSIPWHKSQSLNGNVTISYAEKKNLGGGFDLKYATNKQNKGSFKVLSYSKDPLSFALNHSYSFGDFIQKEDTFAFQLFKTKTIRQFELSTKFALNDIVNYERVSFLPLLALNLRSAKYKMIDLHGGASYGFIAEESTGTGLYRGNVNLEMSTLLASGWTGDFIPKVGGDASLYSNDARWVKSWYALELDKAISSRLSGSIGYRHYLTNRGQSPHRYEMYRFVAADQINTGFLAGWDSSKFGINAVYNLPHFDPQEFDYIMRAGIHCFNITATYRALRRQFNFSFGIN